MKSNNKSSTPMDSSKAENDRALTPLIIVVVVLLLVLIGIVVYYKYLPFPKPKYTDIPTAINNMFVGPSSSPTSSPTPTPTPRPIPHGKGTFGVSTNKKGPRMTEVTLDPYDPPDGSKMLITVSVTNTEAITSVSAIMETDNKTSQPISFILASGTTTQGTWQGTWYVNDSYLYTYNLKLTAKSTNGEHNNVLTLR